MSKQSAALTGARSRLSMALVRLDAATLPVTREKWAARIQELREQILFLERARDDERAAEMAERPAVHPGIRLSKCWAVFRDQEGELIAVRANTEADRTRVSQMAAERQWSSRRYYGSPKGTVLTCD